MAALIGQIKEVAIPSQPSVLECSQPSIERLNMNGILFFAEGVPEGGLTARSSGEPFFSEADSLECLHQQVRDAVHCHFEEGRAPKIIRLHFTREEVFAA